MFLQLLTVLTATNFVQSILCLQGGDGRLIGWEGETYLAEDDSHEPTKLIETISLEPLAYFHHSFLSDDEASHVISVAAPYMKRSQVQAQNGSLIVDGRSSLGTFVWKGLDSIIAGIEAKVADWTGFPIENQEIMQVRNRSTRICSLNPVQIWCCSAFVWFRISH